MIPRTSIRSRGGFNDETFRELLIRKLPPYGDPSHGQTAEELESYYRNVKEGDLAATRSAQHGPLEIKITTRSAQHGPLEIKITTISENNPEIGRVYLTDDVVWTGAAFCMKSGKSCYAPGGQSTLIIPTEEVHAWAKAYPRGTSDWSPG